MMGTDQRPETVAAGHGVATDAAFRAVSPPLHLSTTFAFDGFERPGEFDYGRAGNPNRAMLGEALARLEGGAAAVVTCSGMAAIDLVVSQVAPAGRVIAPHDCYGGTLRLLKARAARGQIDLVVTDLNDRENLSRELRLGAELLIIETPSNPLMRIVDIHETAALGREAGAKVAVDNTFLSPALQRPIALGADFVIHSTTKYLNGHSDVIGGAVVAADAETGAALASWANVVGTTGSPFDAWLTLRGMRTLFPRMERQQDSAMRIALALSEQQAVRRVHYPGLVTHAGHGTAARQQNGFGAMLSFELDGDISAVKAFLETLRLFTLAESLGGVESLAAHPATMTHADMGEEARHVAGIENNLIRLSVGLEHVDDLLLDLRQALDRAISLPTPLCRFEELARREDAARKRRDE